MSYSNERERERKLAIMTAEKRSIDRWEDESRPPVKTRRIPEAPSDHMKALPVEFLPHLLRPYFEFLLESMRNVIREEVTQILMDMRISKPDWRLSTDQIQASNDRKLKLHFGTSLPERIFTGRKLKGRQEEAIEIRLLDATTGDLISSGPESMLELDVVVLDGGFNNLPDVDWAPEDFEKHIVKERVGKGPLLKGDLKVALKNGIATLGNLSFTDNSRWTRNDKFRIGVTISPGHSRYIHVQEAVSDAFCVRENRGEHYEKHDQPDSSDKVWRLKGIAKDGPHHKALTKGNIFTVEDFRRNLVMDQARLRDIFGSKLSKRQWESMVEHAMRCTPSKKVYTYRDGGGPSTIVFNSIYEIRGLFVNDRYIPAESFSENEQVYVNSIKPRAYRDCKSFREFDEEELFGVFGLIHQRRASEEANPILVEPFDHVLHLDVQDTEAHSGNHIPPELTRTTMTSIPESLILNCLILPQTVHESLPENPPTANSNSQAQLLPDCDPSALNWSGSCSSFPGMVRLQKNPSFKRMLLRSPSDISISLEQRLLVHLEGQETELQSGVVPAKHDGSASISEHLHRTILPLTVPESLPETPPTPTSNSQALLFANHDPLALDRSGSCSPLPGGVGLPNSPSIKGTLLRSPSDISISLEQCLFVHLEGIQDTEMRPGAVLLEQVEMTTSSDHLEGAQNLYCMPPGHTMHDCDLPLLNEFDSCSFLPELAHHLGRSWSSRSLLRSLSLESWMKRNDSIDHMDVQSFHAPSDHPNE